MANSLATPKSVRVSHPDYIYSESDPYERIVARLNGLSAMSVIAHAADESDSPPTSLVWLPLWHSLGVIANDIKRDLLELRQKRSEANA